MDARQEQQGLALRDRVQPLALLQGMVPHIEAHMAFGVGLVYQIDCAAGGACGFWNGILPREGASGGGRVYCFAAALACSASASAWDSGKL
jgi:hypothetical protein